MRNISSRLEETVDEISALRGDKVLKDEVITTLAQDSYIKFLKQRQNVCFECEKQTEKSIKIDDYYVCPLCADKKRLGRGA